MTTPNQLSDGALAVFAFAIYHQLASGETITAVAAKDSAGHRADPQAVAELEGLGLAKQNGDMIELSAEGQSTVTQLIDRIRGHW